MDNQIINMLNSLFFENSKAFIFEIDPQKDNLSVFYNASDKEKRHIILKHFFEQKLENQLYIYPDDVACIHEKLEEACSMETRGTLQFRCCYESNEYQYYQMQYASSVNESDLNHVIGIVTNVQDEIDRKAVINGFSSRMGNTMGVLEDNLTITQQVFEVLYNTPVISDAIDTVLEVLGKAFQVDRVYIFEDTPDHLYSNNTYEWCAEGIKPEKENLQHISYEKDLGGIYQDNFDKSGAFVCPDVSKLPKQQYDMVVPQGIKSMLQCVILENGVVSGYIGFDDCKQKRDWSQEQTKTLLLTAKIVGTFLFKLRREEAIVETNKKLQSSLKELQDEQKHVQESDRLFHFILQNANVCIWEYDIRKKEIIQTDSSIKAHGFTRIVHDVPESIIREGYVHADSVAALRAMYRKLDEGKSSAEGIFRLRTTDGMEWKYEHIEYTTLCDEKGNPYKAFAICSDVTEEETRKEYMHRIIDHLPAGIGIFDIHQKKVSLRFLNDAFYEIIHDKHENYNTNEKFDFWKAIHQDDLPIVKKTVTSIEEGNTSLDIKFRFRITNGEYVWIRVIGRACIEESGEAVVYCSFVNVNDFMNTVLELRKNQAMLFSAMKNAKINIWEYHFKTQKVIFPEPVIFPDGVKRVLYHMPQSMIDVGYVHPDSVEKYRNLFSGMFPGGKSIQADVQVKRPDNTGYMWKRLALTPIYNENGDLVVGSGICVDITEQKHTEEKYLKQLENLRTTKDSNLIAFSLYNLTLNRLESINKNSSHVLDDSIIRDYDNGLTANAGLAIQEDDRKSLLSLYSRENLIKEFYNGNTKFNFIYNRRGSDGKIICVESHTITYLDSGTGNIMCFVRSNDITEQKNTREMIDTVVRLDYDYLALLYCKNNEYTLYGKNMGDNCELPPVHSLDYEQAVKDYAQANVVEEDIEQNVHDMSINNIVKQLSDKCRFVCYVNVKTKDGQVRRKQLQFTYFDESRERVLISRVDVTDIHNREQQKVKELQAAKEAAEVANQVKTQFLSRMSHDLRTPMNVIIGLTALARDDINDPQAIEKTLTQINDASKFLLGLVNDCLDIDKIENGKMELHNEPYSYSEFYNNVKTMIEPLCMQKGITFVINNIDQGKTTVIADKVRVEQVYFNLLSNAVKFTPAGGKVEMLTEIVAQDEETVFLKCIVRDNGIGMSDEFQKHMFEPFSQESNEIHPHSQGTGLGLAIVKRLVDMFHGTISVKSKRGIGTEFTLRFTVPVTNESIIANSTGCNTGQLQKLAGKQILLAEDHPLNAMIASKLLEKMQMHVTVATTGKQAYDKFALSEVNFYDAILMDIRMPEMDGLEATKAIRNLDRKDAGTIPIVAMSANAFEEDVRMSLSVGMNAHLSKPIDPMKLYETLAQLIEDKTSMNK